MALKTFAAVVACAGVLAQTGTALGQSITTEAALSAGYSTDDVKVAATQLRVFGDLVDGVRYFGEVAWAKSSNTDNDAFGSAYPYGNRLQVIEAYAERIFQPDNAIVEIRAGRFRTPFGIYSAGDHGYVGFLRPPLVRYADYASLSNDYLEHGADVVVGVPRLTFEMALGAPGDVGDTVRGSGLDTVIRVQGSYGPFIAGASYMRNHSYEPPGDRNFRATAKGIDIRWMQSGVQLRGEWIAGRPVGDATNSGWYVDALVHRVVMGQVTAVARVERLTVDDAGVQSRQGRQTLGARIRVIDPLSVNVNIVRRSGAFNQEYGKTSLDLGLTWTLRYK